MIKQAERTVIAKMILLVSILPQKSDEKALQVEHPAALSRSA
jgi:hypothetical protein